MSEAPLPSPFGPMLPAPISAEKSRQWVNKAMPLARPLVDLAAAVGDPSPVAALKVDGPQEWPYANFMIAWLDPTGEVRHIRHLPDASFFLRLLGRAYAPVLERRPDLAGLLLDDSRPEMSLTNDVLQIQLRSADPGPEYSMVRNHALMLFVAAIWLDEPRRGEWLDLYDELVTYVDRRPEGRPSLEEVTTCEAGAFADLVTLAPLTLDPRTADALLTDDVVLARVLDYQLYAGVAIGLLWREYRSVAVTDREQWYRTHLSELYVRPDYLIENWMGLQ